MKQARIKNLICLIGLPCSGKSSAARLFTTYAAATYISTGDIARQLIDTEAEYTKTISQDLFPREEELRTKLSELIETAPIGPIIVDGFPRSQEQVWFLDKEYHYYNPLVIEINAGDERTLYTRAHFRARDIQDSRQQFTTRLRAASANLSAIYMALQNRLIPHNTIMSASDDVMIKQFKKILKHHGVVI